MAQQKLFQASDGWLKQAVTGLCAAGFKVVAPVKDEDGQVNLQQIKPSDEIALDYINVQRPLKRLFFPATEVLFEYEKADQQNVELKANGALSGAEIVVFGCRPCDASSLVMLDQVFNWDYKEKQYNQRRQQTTVVSFACTETGPQCFCTSVGSSPHSEAGSDVMVYAGYGKSIMKALTDKGKKLIEKLGSVVENAPENSALPAAPEIENKLDPVKAKAWMDDNFESEFWSEASLKCLGCGACSYLCPTCHCFDIVDEATWTRGQRRRNWDCCSFGLFTLHGSGHNPRPNQAARYRQRVLHKFKYFPEKFGHIACVGCGRCIDNCGVGQSIFKVVSNIEQLSEKRADTDGN